MGVEMELTKAGLKKINTLLDGIEQEANDGVFGRSENSGYLVIKGTVLELRQTLKKEADLSPDGGNAA